jgi:hypothetical protein
VPGEWILTDAQVQDVVVVLFDEFGG